MLPAEVETVENDSSRFTHPALMPNAEQRLRPRNITLLEIAEVGPLLQPIYNFPAGLRVCVVF